MPKSLQFSYTSYIITMYTLRILKGETNVSPPEVFLELNLRVRNPQKPPRLSTVLTALLCFSHLEYRFS